MGKGARWTDEDLAKLRPGMVQGGNVRPPAVQQKAAAEKIGIEDPQPPVNYKPSAVQLSTKAEKAIQATGTVRETTMNKTEAAFAQLLEMRQKADEIRWWAFEPMNLRLGVNCFYRIDFMVMESSGRLVAYEVKGHWEDDALVKIRTAAEKFPWPFIAVRKVKGGWEYRNF